MLVSFNMHIPELVSDKRESSQQMRENANLLCADSALHRKISAAQHACPAGMLQGVKCGDTVKITIDREML